MDWDFGNMFTCPQCGYTEWMKIISMLFIIFIGAFLGYQGIKADSDLMNLLGWGIVFLTLFPFAVWIVALFKGLRGLRSYQRIT